MEVTLAQPNCTFTLHGQSTHRIRGTINRCHCRARRNSCYSLLRPDPTSVGEWVSVRTRPARPHPPHASCTSESSANWTLAKSLRYGTGLNSVSYQVVNLYSLLLQSSSRLLKKTIICFRPHSFRNGFAWLGFSPPLQGGGGDWCWLRYRPVNWFITRSCDTS